MGQDGQGVPGRDRDAAQSDGRQNRHAEARGADDGERQRPPMERPANGPAAAREDVLADRHLKPPYGL